MNQKIIFTKPLNSKYSLPDLFRLIWSLVLTRIFFSKARLIRQPTRIRGYKNIRLGRGFTTGQFCRIEAGNRDDGQPTLTIGNQVQLNDKCHIGATFNIKIFDNVLIASNVLIIDHDHGQANYASMSLPPIERPTIALPVIIEKNVWIGENVVILKGVTIGESSIIAAGSVVISDIPRFSVAAGIPARIIKAVDLK